MIAHTCTRPSYVARHNCQLITRYYITVCTARHDVSAWQSPINVCHGYDKIPCQKRNTLSWSKFVSLLDRSAKVLHVVSGIPPPPPHHSPPTSYYSKVVFVRLMTIVFNTDRASLSILHVYCFCNDNFIQVLLSNN